jgi:deoxyribonuclease-4
MTVIFGPAGIPIECGRSTIEGISCVKELGLGAMEMEFVQGVRLGIDSANEIGKKAASLGVLLSSHAPYFINFCSKEEKKVANSKRHLLSAANVTQAAGGSITVFHPGFYQKMPPSEAYAIAKENLEDVEKETGNIFLGAETVGKKSAFGGLDEVLRLSADLEKVKPVIDIAHVHARGDHNLETNDDFRGLFEKIEKASPGYMDDFHFHFSEIEYSEKGERKHIPIGSANTPPFKTMLDVIHESGYSGRIICESPMLEKDAIKMKEYFGGLGR